VEEREKKKTKKKTMLSSAHLPLPKVLISIQTQQTNTYTSIISRMLIPQNETDLLKSFHLFIRFCSGRVSTLR
jgi:hypothetical protein